METRGNCGRGGRCYVGAEDVLKGRLASDYAEAVQPDDEDEADPEVKKCEHGVPLKQIMRCPTCVWMYGLEKRNER